MRNKIICLVVFAVCVLSVLKIHFMDIDNWNLTKEVRIQRTIIKNYEQDLKNANSDITYLEKLNDNFMAENKRLLLKELDGE